MACLLKANLEAFLANWSEKNGKSLKDGLRKFPAPASIKSPQLKKNHFRQSLIAELIPELAVQIL